MKLYNSTIFRVIMQRTKLTVIIPFYNEEHNLGQLHQELTTVIRKLASTSEIIYVDDGSTDGSVKVLERQIKIFKPHRKSIKTTIINFQRNYGQTAAMMAGVEQARGDLIVFLDADLQNDPQDIPLLLEQINKGYDAVFGWRKVRKDTFGRSVASSIANLIIRWIFKVPFHDVGCSLKVYKRSVLKNVHFYGETHRIMAVVSYWSGARICEVPVNHRLRFKDKSKYGFSRILKLMIDLINIKFIHSYGTKPAYIFGTMGFCCILGGFISLLIVSYHKLFQQVYVHRDPVFLIAIFLILVGIQFILMGLLAELLIRTYYESQKKPTYEIKSVRKY